MSDDKSCFLIKRAATLTEEDFVQLGKCRRPHNRLGFAYLDRKLVRRRQRAKRVVLA